MLSISIIIPVYNVEQYVQRCLESVMTQDVIGVDIECLIVDDCGIDRSMEIVRKSIDSYQGNIHFQIISHEKNMGLSAARNTGIMKAYGDYVLFIDSDDYLTSDALSFLISNLQQHMGIDMVVGNVKNMKDQSILLRKFTEPWLIENSDLLFRSMFHSVFRHGIYLYAWNKLIRRSLLLENKIFFINGILYEDVAWSYALFSKANSVLLLPYVTYIYENNPGSIVNTTFTKEKADLAVYSYAVSVTYMLENPPDSQRYRTNMAVDYLIFMSHYLMNAMDIVLRFDIASETTLKLRSVKERLMRRSLRCCRWSLSLFFTLLFTPMVYFQRLRFFRQHYHKMEIMMTRIAHMADFLHNKHR